MRRESENIRSKVRNAKTVHAFIGVQVCSVHCVCVVRVVGLQV